MNVAWALATATQVQYSTDEYSSDPGRFSVGRSSGVGVEDGGGVGEGDCAEAVAIRNSDKRNDNKVRMNSIRL